MTILVAQACTFVLENDESFGVQNHDVVTEGLECSWGRQQDDSDDSYSNSVISIRQWVLSWIRFPRLAIAEASCPVLDVLTLPRWSASEYSWSGSPGFLIAESVSMASCVARRW